jgi:hypothetical protein
MFAWHSALAGSLAGNLSDVTDPVLDETAAAGRGAASISERHDIYGRFAARFRELAPGVILTGEAVLYMVRPEIMGVEQTAVPSPAWRFAGIHRWYLRTD